MKQGFFGAIAISWCVLAIASSAWCADEKPPAGASARQGVFRPGDRLRVTILGFLESNSPTVFVRQLDRDGNIRLPYVGKVTLQGLYPLIAQRELAHVCAASQLATRPRVTVERIAVADPTRDHDAPDDKIAYGDWLRVRTWAGVPPRETRLVLRVAGDGNMRFPDGRLVSVEHMSESYAEISIRSKLIQAAVRPADCELIIERIDDDEEAEAAPDSERVGKWTAPKATAPDGEAPNLSNEKNVTLHALPWQGERPCSLFIWKSSPFGASYSATGRLELILSSYAPVGPFRILWEASLPDGFFELNATAATKDKLFDRVGAAYASTFGASVRRERREVAVLVLSADKPAAEKALVAAPGIVTRTTFGRKDELLEFLHCKGNAERLAALIEDRLKTPVVDETGLLGRYDVELVYRSADQVASLDEAMRPLGLSLKAGRRTIDCVVVRPVEP